jgi:Fe-S-cluster containining protein
MNSIRRNSSGSGDIKAGTMECRRCGVCCTRHQASVSPEELRRIITFLGITADDWEKLYNDAWWRFANYRLIRHIDGACAFLRYTGDLASCAVYSVRPACCVDWQPGPEKRECREGKAKGGDHTFPL